MATAEPMASPSRRWCEVTKNLPAVAGGAQQAPAAGYASGHPFGAPGGVAFDQASRFGGAARSSCRALTPDPVLGGDRLVVLELDLGARRSVSRWLSRCRR